MIDRNSYWRRVGRVYFGLLVIVACGALIASWFVYIWSFVITAALVLVTLPLWAAALDKKFGSVK